MQKYIFFFQQIKDSALNHIKTEPSFSQSIKKKRFYAYSFFFRRTSSIAFLKASLGIAP